jgi:glycosyltransferase involved in cell wall biosynthesis
LVGHIGRLSAGKGAGVLLDAFIEVYKEHKHVKLLLAGTTTDFTIELKQKIRLY